MVWPTLGSRTAKEQNGTGCDGIAGWLRQALPCIYSMSPKRSPFYFFELLCQKLTDFINFGYVKSREDFDMSILQICPPHLSDVATLPREIQKAVLYRTSSD